VLRTLASWLPIAVDSSMSRAFAWYRGMLNSKPLATRMVTAFGLASTSDFCAQGMSGDSKYDPKRTFKMGCAAGCLHAPMFYRWFLFLEKAGFVGSPSVIAVKKLCVESLTVGTLSCFLSVLIFHCFENRLVSILPTYSRTCVPRDFDFLQHSV
jgi:hypothetical protein